MQDIERIKREYRMRETDPHETYIYNNLNEAHYFAIVQRERNVIKILKSTVDTRNISEMKFLDIGCGTGWWLQRLIFFGMRPENLYGIDLMEERIQLAREISSPRINFVAQNAERLPYPTAFFDVIFQFMALTSILDCDIRRNIAKEMVRVLNPKGKIIWYDFPPYAFGRWLSVLRRRRNDKYNVAPIGLAEVRRLFPDCRITTRKKVMLHFRLAWLSKYSWALCMLLERIPILRTHYLLVIERAESVGEGC